jgi:UDP-glucose 4-epimerase
VPFVMQTAAGIHPTVRVYGSDYPTPDGTGIRDYLHVVDLADAHVAAMAHAGAGCRAVNLGTGSGHSVLEVLAASERAVGRPIPHVMADRRPGDAAAVWADPTLARDVLGWEATRDLDTMCADAWRWQTTLGQPST